MKAFFLFALLLSGCFKVGPNYKAPESCIDGEWNANLEKGMVSQEESIIKWWELLNDPLLTECIEKAIASNFDLAKASSNILGARAMRQVQASALFPQIIADINGTRTYFSKNGPVFAIGVPTAAGQPTETGSVSQNTGLPFFLQIPQMQSLFNALFDATWEIDLFGKVRRGVEAYSAMIGVAIEQRNDLLITLAAEVAKNYVELRTFQKEAACVEEMIALLEQKVKIIEQGQAFGYFNALDYEEALASFAQSKALLSPLIARSYRAIYAISALTSLPPESLLPMLLEPKPIPLIPEKIAVGLRSDFIRQRPDVRAAERKLAAATANVGVAVASFFPSITLGADGGWQSLSIKNLFQGSSKTWGVGGDINLPIFEGGKLVGNYKASRALLCESAFNYKQTVINALEDAESRLISYQEDLLALENLKAQCEAKKAMVTIGFERFTKGLTSRLSFISQKEALIRAQELYAAAEGLTLADFIALYKALGGGWQGSCEISTC